MTPAQIIILRRIEAGECHPHGTNLVRVVRRLSEQGLVTLEDCGRMRGNDSERWFAALTNLGRAVLKESCP